jgi:hypothetical protein
MQHAQCDCVSAMLVPIKTAHTITITQSDETIQPPDRIELCFGFVCVCLFVWSQYLPMVDNFEVPPVEGHQLARRLRDYSRMPLECVRLFLIKPKQFTHTLSYCVH